MRTTITSAVTVLVALLAGCDSAPSPDKPAPSAAATATAKPATTAASTAATAATAAATAAGAAAPPAAGEVMTVARLQDAFKADEKAWMGKRVKVAGVYFSTTEASSGGKTSITLSIATSKEDTKGTVGCEVGTAPAGLMQYTPVVVEGTVDKGFGARLKDCTLTKK